MRAETRRGRLPRSVRRGAPTKGAPLFPRHEPHRRSRGKDRRPGQACRDPIGAAPRQRRIVEADFHTGRRSRCWSPHARRRDPGSGPGPSATDSGCAFRGRRRRNLASPRRRQPAFGELCWRRRRVGGPAREGLRDAATRCQLGSAVCAVAAGVGPTAIRLIPDRECYRASACAVGFRGPPLGGRRGLPGDCPLQESYCIYMNCNLFRRGYAVSSCFDRDTFYDEIPISVL